MRLVELDPRWVSEDGRHGQGLDFLCPHCRELRLVVFFERPLDEGAPLAWQRLWARAGSTFETLTLRPSNTGHWHGLITDGAIA